MLPSVGFETPWELTRLMWVLNISKCRGCVGAFRITVKCFSPTLTGSVPGLFPVMVLRLLRTLNLSVELVKTDLSFTSLVWK